MTFREREVNPSQIDRLLVITRPVDWAALGALLLLLAALGAWLFLGKIPVKVSGTGVLVGSGGIHSIAASCSGEISDLLVKQGDQVKKGDVLCHLSDPGMVGSIAFTPGVLASLLRGEKPNIPAQPEASLGFQVRYRKRVVSPYDGIVSRVFHLEGDRVTEGIRLFRITPLMTASDEQFAYVFVAASVAPQIQVGVRADIYPDAVNRQRYGSLVGVVQEVGTMPVGPATVRDKVADERLVERLMGADGKFMVKVLVQRRTDRPGDLLWSSGHGPPVQLEQLEGSLCAVDMTVSNLPAIQLLSPNAQ